VLTARIVSAADGRDLVSLRETAKDETEIIAALDKLSKRLRERVGESLKSLQNTESLEQVTTGSMEALRKYSQAVRLDDAGQSVPAYALLKEAVAADSTFAMAWRKAAAIGPRAGAPAAEVRAAYRRAFELRARLPALEQRLTEASFYSQVEIDPGKEEAAWRAVLALDPDDRVALNNLALELNEQGRYVEAESLARRAIPVDRSWFSYGHLAGALGGQGRFAEADSVLQELAAFSPGSPRNPWLQAEAAYTRRDYARGDSLAAELKRQHDGANEHLTSMNLRAGSARARGRLAEEALLVDSASRLAMSIGNVGARHTAVLRVLEADRDLRPVPRYGKADLDTVLRAFPIDSVPLEDRAYFWLAATYAELGDPATARKFLAEADRSLPAYLRDTEDRHYAEGAVAMAEERWGDAVARFRAAEAVPNAWCRNCLAFAQARAFDRMGQPDSALAQYERGIRSPEYRRLRSDAIGLAPALRRAGELAEQKGDRAKAREYYNQFLDLWAGADGDLQPVVRDVRGRLAGLGGDR
jgi:tetratricopeptide (TPR) repeat protein